MQLFSDRKGGRLDKDPHNAQGETKIVSIRTTPLKSGTKAGGRKTMKKGKTQSEKEEERGRSIKNYSLTQSTSVQGEIRGGGARTTRKERLHSKARKKGRPGKKR